MPQRLGPLEYVENTSISVPRDYVVGTGKSYSVKQF